MLTTLINKQFKRSVFTPLNSVLHYLKINYKLKKEESKKNKFLEMSPEDEGGDDYLLIKDYFDFAYYKQQINYKNIKSQDFIKHYLDEGWKEGLNPAKWFDSKTYLEVYVDVRKANINPFVHYLKHGFKENRLPKPKDNVSLIEQYVQPFKNSGYSLKHHENIIEIEGEGIKIAGKSENTIWTAFDVLCKRDYDFLADKKYIMFDIGFNIGITSIHFAQKPNFLHIYAFEPFKPTYDIGMQNVYNNQLISKKITVYNYGLAAKKEKIKIHYNPLLPGSMSTVVDRFIDCQNIETVQLLRASTELKKIMRHFTGVKIFLKIDCEGAEYEILKDLDNADLLKKVDTIILEWHDGRVEVLSNILLKNNFLVFVNHTGSNNQGMIRATRT